MGGLIALRAVLSLSYGALTNVRLPVLREQAEEGNRGAAKIVKLVERQRHYMITHQLTTMLLDMSLMTVAAVLWGPALQLAFGLPDWLAYALVVTAIVLISLIIGVLVPEAVGSAQAYGMARFAAPLVNALIVLFFPVTKVMVVISRWISATMASESKVNTVTEEEIMTLVDAGASDGTIEEEEQEMIYSVLQLDETSASELMVPRIDMVSIEIHRSLEDARIMFIETGHSRIPVYEDDVDTIKGVLYAKDLLPHWHNNNKKISDLMRPAYFVPMTKPADELMRELQGRRVHMAIVVDEYGGTAGIVTIEDLIEEIIGEIQDEYDKIQIDECIEVGENQYSVDAGIDLDDFNEIFETDFSTDDTDTLAGVIYSHFNSVPDVGAEFEIEDLKIKVESVDGRRIRRVLVTRILPTDDTPSTDGEAVKDADDPSGEPKREKAS